MRTYNSMDKIPLTTTSKMHSHTLSNSLQTGVHIHHHAEDVIDPINPESTSAQKLPSLKRKDPL
jgi:hypothetical protein